MSKQDVIRWCKNSETEQEWIECVSCGYHEDKPDEVMNAEHPQQSTDGIVNIVRFK
jgi:Zn ribbon nucleic-acid-binding protein